MKTFFAKDYGIKRNTEVSSALSALFERTAQTDDEKEIIFDEGDYFIDSGKCRKEILYITNSSADDDWGDGETPHLSNVALFLRNQKNLTVRGGGARFVIDGRVTNVVIDGCENVTLEGIEITVKNPDMHEFRVIKTTPLHVDFSLDEASVYTERNGGYFYCGKDITTSMTDGTNKMRWTGNIPADDINCLRRTNHPFAGAVKVIKIAPYKFRAYYVFHRKFDVGERFVAFDVRRKNAGIFINGSRNVVIKNVKQRFNYGLALAAQDTENITIDSVEFAPSEAEPRLMASVADFIQICMCKGLAEIKNSYFEGAGDDCLNVHGIHFKIVKMCDKTLIVRFCHSQTYGFNPLHAGDTVEYVSPDTLEKTGEAKIIHSKTLDKFNIELTVDAVDGAREGLVVEDTTMCPDLRFCNNTLNRIITRGILVTTRGKVLVENNRFLNTAMNGILFSDDAKSWYESGRLTDVVIRGNYFGRCPAYTVCILPENGLNKNAVHGKFLIEDNVIDSEKGGFYFKCAEKVVLKNNTKRKIIAKYTDVEIVSEK